MVFIYLLPLPLTYHSVLADVTVQAHYITLQLIPGWMTNTTITVTKTK